MKKAELEKRLNEIEQELKELKEVLEADPEAYAEKLNSEGGRIKWSPSDTYPYRLGVAQATIKHILNPEF